MPGQSDDDPQEVRPQQKGQAGVSRRGFLAGAGLTTANAAIVEGGSCSDQVHIAILQ